MQARAFEKNFMFKVRGWHWLNVKSVLLKLWEEFVKVRGMEMGKNDVENQNGWLAVGLRVWVQMGFLCFSSWYICITNYVRVCAYWKNDWSTSCRLSVSSGWRFEYDTALMRRHNEGKTLYMCEQFGVDEKLYVEVIRIWYFMVKRWNGLHHHAHQVWLRQKLLITFHLLRSDDDTGWMWSLWC